MNEIDPREVSLREMMRTPGWKIVRDSLQAKVDTLKEAMIYAENVDADALRRATGTQAQIILLEELLADPVKALLNTDSAHDAPPVLPRVGAGGNIRRG